VNLWPRSLRWRLGLLYAVVIASALAVVLVAVDVLVERALIDSTAARLEVEAGLIAAGTSARGGQATSPETSLAASDVARVLGGQDTAAVVLDASGETLASEANGAPETVLDARLDPAAYTSIVATGNTVEQVLDAADGSGQRVLVVAAAIRFTTPGVPQASPTPAPASSPGAAAEQSPAAGPGKGLGRGLGRGIGRGVGLAGGAAAGGTVAGSASTSSTAPGSSGASGAGSAASVAANEAPNAVAQLAVSLAAVDATLASVRTTLLGVGLAAFAIALAVVFVVTGLGLRPLARVAAAADRVATGDLSARARLPSGTDEIGRLGRAFDQMVDRLDGAFAAQRQFAADASHELRSPLTVLGGYVDVLARGAQEAPDSATRILGSMRREIDRLSRLAADLLLLTQLEAGGGRLAPERLDVGVLLTDLGEAARVIGEGRRVTVERGGPLPVIADHDRLTQALLNLVDNAVRHTPEGGLITLSGHRDDTTIVVEVFNEGEPIPREHLPHLFDRFYRVSRASAPGRHAGLGLAIVKAIIEASGGAVSATSDAAGTRFIVWLPLAPGADSQLPLSQATGSLQEAPVR
jgi:two-component system, OmpR family, sensor kinase